MLRKSIKLTALSLFTLSLLASFYILSLSDYRLSETIITRQGDAEKFRILSEAAGPMTGKTYEWNFRFIKELKKTIDQANTEIKNRYGITGQIVEEIIEKAREGDKYVFSSAWMNEIISDDTEYGQFRIKQIKDYSGWMEGKTYASAESLKKDLDNLRTTINNNLVSSRGFSDYETGQLAFSITKDASQGILVDHLWLWFILSIGLMMFSGLVYGIAAYGWRIPGIKNDHIFHSPAKSLGWLGIILGIILTGFYILIYFYPEYLTNWVLLVDPFSRWLNGGEASHWFLYGFMYTLAILVMGVRMFLKYRGNRYQMIRTVSVMFFQLGFAFLIPEIMTALNQPAYDFKNIWPLDYDFFYGYNLNNLMTAGFLGWFILFWGIGLILLAVPFLSFFFGKRWYCSWVCGCGGLAETLGDPFRQLSDKSLKAWKIERWMVHSVLVFVVILTGAVLYTFFTGSYTVLWVNTESIKTVYGFLIGSVFAGVIGVGFYPLMGNRVWCRFGCPLAAYLGIVQRFKSRFRITTNGGQCISCGNCSTYCEMGIDVRWYAQRGQNIIRASCVGCGICASVCPRGVLKLENKKEKGRFNGPRLVGNENYQAVEA